MKANLRSLKVSSLAALLAVSGVAAAVAGGVLATPSAFAVAIGTPTARAKAVMKDLSNVTRGTVLLTEYMSNGTSDQRVDVTGTMNAPLSVLSAGEHGLHIWEGDCSHVGPSFDNLSGHVDFVGLGHPYETGDLPNITVVDMGDGTGRASIRFTKITNRFKLSAPWFNTLNLWDTNGIWAAGPLNLAIAIDDIAATESGAGTPILCGELHCDDAGNCVEGGQPL